MAISIVGTPQHGNTPNGGTVTLTFDGTPAEGDMVLLFGGHGDSDASPVIGPSDAGYTEQHTYLNDSSEPNVSCGVWTKFLGASPDASVTGQSDGDNDSAVAYGCLVLRGVPPSTPIDVAIVETSGLTNNPDPSGVTTVTDGAWVFSFAASQHQTPPSSGDQPSGYTFRAADGRLDGRRFSFGLASIEVASAGSEDPGAWVYNTNGGFVTFTVAIRPAGGAGGTPGTASPATTGLSFAIPQATAASPGSASPDNIAPTVSTPAPGTAGSGVAEPDAVSPTLSIETPTPAGAAVVTPDAVSTSFTIPTPTAVEGEDAGTAQPDAIAPTLTLPAPTPAGGAVALPDTIAVTVVMPAPAAKGAGTVTPDEIAVAVSLGAVTVEGGAVVTPDTITLTLTLPQATADGQVPAELIAQVINSTFGRQVVTGSQIRQAITGDTFIS